MAAKYSAHSAASTVLSTELNSLADGGNKISASQSNDGAAERQLFANFGLQLAAQASARSTGALIHLYIIPEVDGSFAYGSDSLNPASKHYRGSFEFDNTTAAQHDVVSDVRLPNADYKVLLINETGQSLAASGNVIKAELYEYEDA